MGIIRKTKSVKAVINEFDRTAFALSTLKLVESLQSQMNKSTVYRILERLVDDGILHSFTGKDGLSWYALNHCHQAFQFRKSKAYPSPFPVQKLW